jgi:transporter family-2 protein
VSGNAFAASFAVAGGLAVAIQAAVNAALGRRVGVTETALLSGVGTTIILGAVLLVQRGGTGGLGDLGRVPAWTLAGGLLGSVALSALSFAPARIGVFAALACFLAGQLALALLIDAYGLLEVERTPVTATRVVGLLLVAAGAALVLRR